MARRRRSVGASASLFDTAESDTWQVFNTVPEFLDGAEKLRAVGFGNSPESWAGGSWSDAVAVVAGGDLAAVSDASKYADMINDAVELAGIRSEWLPDMVGAFPSVPAYLAGDPCSMWSRSPIQDERGEMSIFVNIGASSNVKAEELRRRGVCVLACVLALSRVRSVRLSIYTSMKYIPVGVRLSYPLDVSQACAFITRPEVMRQLFLAYGRKAAMDHNTGSVGWCRWSETLTCDYNGERRAVLDGFAVRGSALVLTPHKLGSWAGLTDRQFVEKLNGIIAAVNGGQDLDSVTL